jgi:hypothetical protein
LNQVIDRPSQKTQVNAQSRARMKCGERCPNLN